MPHLPIPSPSGEPPADPAGGQADTPVSCGAAFMLLTTLALAVALHPFAGSLVYGPTSRLWIFSPLACAADTAAVWRRLGEHAAAAHGWSRPRHEAASDRPRTVALREAALAIVAARAMNEPSGARRRAFQGIRGAEDGMQLLATLMAGFGEGWRHRLAVALPILAQYTKIMAMSGIYIPKIVGSLLMVHWATMELLLLLARPDQPLAASPSAAEELIARIEQLLLLAPTAPDLRPRPPAAQQPTMHEALLWPLHRCGLALLPALMEHGSLWVAWLSVTLSVPVVLAWLASSLETSEPRAGGDAGVVCFGIWILYCATGYDSAGTARPDWPWLDWLG